MMKNRLFSAPLAIVTAVLALLLAASVAANVILARRVVVEHERLKNSVVPIGSVDYYRQRLAAVEEDKRLRELELYADNIDVADESSGDLDIDHPEKHVNFVSQLPEYPNGCEAACAVMMLNYHGYDISLSDFIEDYLPRDRVYEQDGVRYGPDPAKYYAGDPAVKDGGWGCFAPVICESVKKVVEKDPSLIYDVIDLSGAPLDAVSAFPAVIWVTTDYTEVKEVFQWRSYDETQTYSYPRNQHAVVVVNMDENNYYILDPMMDEKEIAVPKNTLVACYDSMGRQAVIIYGPFTRIPIGVPIY